MLISNVSESAIFFPYPSLFIYSVGPIMQQQIDKKVHHQYKHHPLTSNNMG